MGSYKEENQELDEQLQELCQLIERSGLDAERNARQNFRQFQDENARIDRLELHHRARWQTSDEKFRNRQ